MQIKTATFVAGITGASSAIKINLPQVAFIGRSNVGKSSTINTITNNKKLAHTSSYPGRTQQLNLFLINDNSYLVDLPGYGFTKTSKKAREKIEALIEWYFNDSEYKPTSVVLIVDANIGPTESDKDMLAYLESSKRNIIVLANKVDKIKQKDYTKRMNAVKDFAGENKVIPFSSEKKRGISELVNEIFS